MKVSCFPSAVAFARQFREEAPSNHVFGWFIGTVSEESIVILGSIGCVHFSRTEPSNSSQLCLPDFAKELSAFDVLLPVGVEVVGFYTSQNGTAPEDLASLSQTVAGSVVTRQPLVTCFLAVKEAYVAREPLSALSWSNNVNFDESCAAKFNETHVPLVLRAQVGQEDKLDVKGAHFSIARTGGIVAFAKVAQKPIAEVVPSKPNVYGGLDFSRTVTWMFKQQPQQLQGLELHYGNNATSSSPVSAELVKVGYFSPSKTLFGQALEVLADRLERIRASGAASGRRMVHFQPRSGPAFCCSVIAQGNNDTSAADRDELEKRLKVKSFYYSNNDVISIWQTGPSRLLNVHQDILNRHELKDAKVAVVEGYYEYCHYMQDKFNDDGWGCAYRSLQTICSWLRLQGFVKDDIPSHAKIQSALVQLGDKEKEFIGSKQWIGAVEISMILNHWFGLDCRILNIASGAEVLSKTEDLLRHFRDEKSPIMIGGGVLAWTLLGVAVADNKTTKYLILDPHYTGEDDVKTIQKKGWIGWKPESVFRKDAFYNFCCPLVRK